MRKYARVPAYDKPVATLYVYVKFKKEPVKLPTENNGLFKGTEF